MGVRLSKQIAELVIATCQQVNDDGRIDDILLIDEAFRRQLAHLSKEIPISLRNIIITKKYRERKDYGGKEITEHRAFKALWNASDPELKPIIQSSLLEWYENPESFVNKKSKTLPEVQSISSYLSVLYHLQESQQIDRVHWRLFLIPLSNVFETLGRSWGWRTTIDTDLISLLSNAGLIAENEKHLCQYIPSWHSKSKRYRILAEEVGYGGLCCLPDDISNLLWEKDLPSKGEVHDACISLLIDHQIKEAASANVTGNDDNFITADTAAETVVNSLCGKIQFLSCNPREPSTERSHASNLGSRASHVQDGIPSSESGLIRAARISRKRPAKTHNPRQSKRRQTKANTQIPSSSNVQSSQSNNITDSPRRHRPTSTERRSSCDDINAAESLVSIANNRPLFVPQDGSASGSFTNSSYPPHIEGYSESTSYRSNEGITAGSNATVNPGSSLQSSEHQPRNESTGDYQLSNSLRLPIPESPSDGGTDNTNRMPNSFQENDGASSHSIPGSGNPPSDDNTPDHPNEAPLPAEIMLATEQSNLSVSTDFDTTVSRFTTPTDCTPNAVQSNGSDIDAARILAVNDDGDLFVPQNISAARSLNDRNSVPVEEHVSYDELRETSAQAHVSQAVELLGNQSLRTTTDSPSQYSTAMRLEPTMTGYKDGSVCDWSQLDLSEFDLFPDVPLPALDLSEIPEFDGFLSPDKT